MLTEINTNLLVAAGVDPLAAREIAEVMTNSGMVRLGSVSAGEYGEAPFVEKSRGMFVISQVVGLDV